MKYKRCIPWYFKKLFLLVAATLLFSFFTPQAHAAQILINEFVAHPASGSKEWVEFYNPDHADLSRYYIDDDTDFTSDSGNSAKKKLDSLVVSNPTFPFIELSSMLNNSGDHVVLFDSTGNVIDQYEYTKDPGTNVAIGRSPDGSGNWATLVSATQGSPNSSAVTPSPSPSPTPTPTPTSLPAQRTTSSSTSKSAMQASVVTTASKQTTQSSTAQNQAGTRSNSVLIASSDNAQEVNLDQDILGASTKSAAASPSPTRIAASAKPVRTLATNSFNIGKIFIALGILLIASCGILLFYSRLKVLFKEKFQK